ncbi:MAG: hypothetical protein LBJ83_01110 [Oscillospiraceae bacterium]|jgi:hypothetical protein|nr:hypothetical protein [Oscillospiraceae bacterium]
MKFIVKPVVSKGYCFCDTFAEQLQDDIKNKRGHCQQVCSGHCSAVSDGYVDIGVDFDSDVDCDMDLGGDFDSNFFDSMFPLGSPFTR